MIISGASLPCRPDPLCVCCENNLHCGCFVPPSRPRILGIHVHVHTYGVHCDALSCENLDKCMMTWTAARLSLHTGCLLCWPLSLSIVLSISSYSFVPSSFHLPHLHPFCPLLLYLLLFCTCPCRVHLSDPVTSAAGRQIASTPTGLNIALLSAALDQIALTVYQQTRWDSRLHSHERTHIKNNYIIVTAIVHHIQLLYPCAITLFTLWHICLSSVMFLS